VELRKIVRRRAEKEGAARSARAETKKIKKQEEVRKVKETSENIKN